MSHRIRALLQQGINKSIIRARVSGTAPRTCAARSPLIVLFMYGAAPRPSHGKMNDPGRKVNIQPAENEFSELMRSLRARTDNEGNHVGRDFVCCEGIDRKIFLPIRADQPSPANVHAVMDVFSKSRVKKPYLSYSLLLRAIYGFSNYPPVPPGPPGPLYWLINWQSDGRKALEVC